GLGAGGNGVRLCIRATGRAVRVLHAPCPQGGVSAVAFSPDGTLLATGGDSAVGVGNPATSHPAGPPIHAASAHAGVFGVAFSPDGTLLATAGGDGTVRVWNPAPRQPPGPPIHATSPLVPPAAVAFRANGKLLAAADH